jgi:hypothetical protein
MAMTASGDDHRLTGLLLFGGAALVFALMIAMPWAKREMALRLCDDAIREQLKAPSTYDRIEYLELGDDDDRSYWITYDAQNAFGVPLRSKGSCRLNTDRTAASWSQLTRP